MIKNAKTWKLIHEDFFQSTRTLQSTFFIPSRQGFDYVLHFLKIVTWIFWILLDFLDRLLAIRTDY